MAMTIPPMTPPTIAGLLDLRGDDADWEDAVGERDVGDGVKGVGVAAINSGPRNECPNIDRQKAFSRTLR